LDSVLSDFKNRSSSSAEKSLDVDFSRFTLMLQNLLENL